MGKYYDPVTRQKYREIYARGVARRLREWDAMSVDEQCDWIAAYGANRVSPPRTSDADRHGGALMASDEPRAAAGPPPKAMRYGPGPIPEETRALYAAVFAEGYPERERQWHAMDGYTKDMWIRRYEEERAATEWRDQNNGFTDSCCFIPTIVLVSAFGLFLALIIANIAGCL